MRGGSLQLLPVGGHALNFTKVTRSCGFFVTLSGSAGKCRDRAEGGRASGELEHEPAPVGQRKDRRAQRRRREASPKQREESIFAGRRGGARERAEPVRRHG